MQRKRKKEKNLKSNYPCEIEIKISPRIVDFPVLKKTEFHKVNVSSPYIMMWNTVNESWFLVKYLVKIKKVIE